MNELSFNDFKQEVLADYSLAVKCRVVQKKLEKDIADILIKLAILKVKKDKDILVLESCVERMQNAILEEKYEDLFLANEVSNRLSSSKKNDASIKLEFSLSYLLGRNIAESLNDNKKGDEIVFSLFRLEQRALSGRILGHLAKQSFPMVISLQDTIGVGRKMLHDIGYPAERVLYAESWGYTNLCQAYANAVSLAEKERAVVFVVVNDVGLHAEGVLQMSRWIVGKEISNKTELLEVEQSIHEQVERDYQKVEQRSSEPKREVLVQLKDLINQMPSHYLKHPEVEELVEQISEVDDVAFKGIEFLLEKVVRYFTPMNDEEESIRLEFLGLLKRVTAIAVDKQQPFIHLEEAIPVLYNEQSEMMQGSVIMKENFPQFFHKYPNLCVLAQGKIIYKKIGTAIDTIDNPLSVEEQFSQAVGLAMGGCKVILEMQSSENLWKCLKEVELLVARYGNLLGAIIIRTQENAMLGAYLGSLSEEYNCSVCIPRDMVQAIGCYSHLLTKNNLSVVVEAKSLYTQWTKQPFNLSELYIPVGCSEVIFSGKDITVVSYGGVFSWVEKAVTELEYFDVSVELIDLQYVSPIDFAEVIAQSVMRTGRLLVVSSEIYKMINLRILKMMMESVDVYSKFLMPPETFEICRDICESENEVQIVSSIFNYAYGMMNRWDSAIYPQLY